MTLFRSCCRQRGETILDIHHYFPYESVIHIGQPRVYVTYWNGPSEIFSIQKVLPAEIPSYPLIEGKIAQNSQNVLGVPLPGVTIDPSEVPSLLYDLSATESYSYTGLNESSKDRSSKETEHKLKHISVDKQDSLMSSLVDYEDSDEEITKAKYLPHNNDQKTPAAEVFSESSECLKPTSTNSAELEYPMIHFQTRQEKDILTDEVAESGTVSDIQSEAVSFGEFSDYIQEKATIEKLLKVRKKGLQINQYILNSPQFQNPYCLENIMDTFDVVSYSSNYEKSIYDPEAIATWEVPRFQRLVRQKMTPPTPPPPPPTTTDSKTPNQQKRSSPAASIMPSSSSGLTSSSARSRAKRRLNKWDIRD